MKKRNFILKIVAFSTVMAVFTIMLSANTAANTASGGSVGNLTAYGSGVINVKPDIAVLNIAVVTRGKDTSIQKENSTAMAKVIEAVKKAGVEEKDIITSNYYLNPEYDYNYEKGGQTMKGYVVYNRINVTVRNIEKAGDILSQAEKAGANEIGGITFTVSTPSVYYKQALEKAIADAKGKAEVMAKAAGVTLGKAFSISEGVDYNAYNNYTNRNTGNIVPMAESAVADSGVGVQTGEIAITANVTMVFGY